MKRVVIAAFPAVQMLVPHSSLGVSPGDYRSRFRPILSEAA